VDEQVRDLRILVRDPRIRDLRDARDPHQASLTATRRASSAKALPFSKSEAAPRVRLPGPNGFASSRQSNRSHGTVEKGEPMPGCGYRANRLPQTTLPDRSVSQTRPSPIRVSRDLAVGSYRSDDPAEACPDAAKVRRSGVVSPRSHVAERQTLGRCTGIGAIGGHQATSAVANARQSVTLQRCQDLTRVDRCCVMLPSGPGSQSPDPLGCQRRAVGGLGATCSAGPVQRPPHRAGPYGR
jgi:hypothetical protein